MCVCVCLCVCVCVCCSCSCLTEHNNKVNNYMNKRNNVNNYKNKAHKQHYCATSFPQTSRACKTSTVTSVNLFACVFPFSSRAHTALAGWLHCVLHYTGSTVVHLQRDTSNNNRTATLRQPEQPAASELQCFSLHCELPLLLLLQATQGCVLELRTNALRDCLQLPLR